MAAGPEDPGAPTERLRPREPAVRERAATYETSTYDAWLGRLDDRLRSLTTVVVVVGLLALAALAVAVYGVIHENRLADRADSAAVSNLRSRVSELEGRTAGSAGKGTISSLNSRLSQKANESDLQRLGDEVSRVRSSVAGLTGANGAVATLRQQVDQLDQQVSQLQSSSSSGTSTTP